MELRYTIFKTRFGFSGLVASCEGLLSLILPAKLKEVKTRIEESYKNLVLDPLFFKEITSRIVAYLEGEKVIFNPSLDLFRFTPFQKRVFKATQNIHYGETRSYLSLAKGIKSSPRATGQALKRNPIPIIIPCHRVIRENGGLGGYSAGQAWKKRLLSLEKVNV